LEQENSVIAWQRPIDKNQLKKVKRAISPHLTRVNTLLDVDLWNQEGGVEHLFGS
jgi:hypothetical protein